MISVGEYKKKPVTVMETKCVPPMLIANNTKPLIVFFCFFMSTALANNNSLCQNEEDVLFSCITKQNKTISLCSAKKLAATEGYIQYRFGKKNDIEFIYPTNKDILANKAFQGRSQMFSGGGALYLRFKNKEYDYIIYSGIGKGWEICGLILLKNGKFLSYFACTDKSIQKLSPNLLEQLDLEKDEIEYFPSYIE